MSVNFGYGGMGMMNGMGMTGGMGTQGGNTFQNMASQYNCPMCYQYGAVPYNYQTYVNPLPKQAVNPSWLSRLVGKFFG